MRRMSPPRSSTGYIPLASDDTDQISSLLSAPSASAALPERKEKHPELKSEEKIEDETSLKMIITSSEILDRDPAIRAAKILEKYNARSTKAGIRVITVAGSLRGGVRLGTDEFLLAHVNKTPALGMSTNGSRLTTPIYLNPRTETAILNTVKQDANYYGAHGSYVVNVPLGQYAKASSGGRAILLGEGAHVIHDPLFKFTEQYVNQFDNYISHGNLHILRVLPGQYAKVVINNKAYLLQPRAEPYVFNSLSFVFDPSKDYVNQSDNYIEHRNLRILRVQPGYLAKVVINGEYKLLESKAEPYVFDTPFFQKFDPGRDFVSQSDSYIKHGNLHILRVPAGCIAKVWKGGSTPELLESKSEAYVFNDPLFKLETTLERGTEYNFVNSTIKLIQHGSLKRIIPPVNEVAITNNNGDLEIITVAKLIKDPNHAFVDFLDISIRTLEFPSDKTKARRIKDNKDAKADEIAFIPCTASDSGKVGIKLLVAFQITDPVKAWKLGGLEGILEHIERVTTSDMERAVQQFSSQDFLKYFSVRSEVEHKSKSLSSSSSSTRPSPTAPAPISSQDDVTEQVKHELKEVGINVIRLNIQEAKNLNPDIAAKMAEQSLSTAKVNAELAILSQDSTIALSRAKAKADVSAMEIKQINENKLATSQADITAAQSRADAKMIEAKGNADAAALVEITAAKTRAETKKLDGEANAHAKRVEAKAVNDALERQGEIYRACPQLLELEKEKLKWQALSRVNFTVTSAEFSGLYSTPGTTLFGPAVSRAPLLPVMTSTPPGVATVPAIVSEATLTSDLRSGSSSSTAKTEEKTEKTLAM